MCVCVCRAINASGSLAQLHLSPPTLRHLLSTCSSQRFILPQRPLTPQARKQQSILDSAPHVDASWNAQLEKERQEEITVISDACGVLGREVYEIQPDGHCMYSAVADQLGQLGMLPPHQVGWVWSKVTSCGWHVFPSFTCQLETRRDVEDGLEMRQDAEVRAYVVALRPPRHS